MDEDSIFWRHVLWSDEKDSFSTLSRVSDTRHRVKIENKLTKLEKDILLSFENERNLNESLALSAIKSNPKLFYTYAKNNAKVKAKIGPLIKNEVVISIKKTSLRCCVRNTIAHRLKNRLSTPTLPEVSNYLPCNVMCYYIVQ